MSNHGHHDQPHLFGDEVKPWERQWGESSRAYAAFCIYRDLGRKRSLDKAFQSYCAEQQKPLTADGRAPGQWALWSAKNSWPARAAAYDDHLDRENREARESRSRELAR